MTYAELLEIELFGPLSEYFEPFNCMQKWNSSNYIALQETINCVQINK